MSNIEEESEIMDEVAREESMKEKVRQQIAESSETEEPQVPSTEVPTESEVAEAEVAEEVSGSDEQETRSYYCPYCEYEAYLKEMDEQKCPNCGSQLEPADSE